MCCSTSTREQLSTSISPWFCRYDKFSVDITEQVGADLEGQHELTVEGFDPTGASKGQRHIGKWGYPWTLLCVGRAGCILMPILGSFKSAGATFSLPHSCCDVAFSCPHACGAEAAQEGHLLDSRSLVAGELRLRRCICLLLLGSLHGVGVNLMGVQSEQASGRR